MSTTHDPLPRDLEWGPKGAVPLDTARAAWGARAILESRIKRAPGRTHTFTLLHDRQDTIGDAAAIRARLNGALLQTLKNRVHERVQRVGPNSFDLVTLYEQDGLTVQARINGGYVYLAAWVS